jgi:hypothetical protein
MAIPRRLLLPTALAFALSASAASQTPRLIIQNWAPFGLHAIVDTDFKCTGTLNNDPSTSLSFAPGTSFLIPAASSDGAPSVATLVFTKQGQSSNVRLFLYGPKVVPGKCQGFVDYLATRVNGVPTWYWNDFPINNNDPGFTITGNQDGITFGVTKE